MFVSLQGKRTRWQECDGEASLQRTSCEGIQLCLYGLKLVVEIEQLLVTEFH